MKKYLLLILTLAYVAYSNAQELNIHVQKISWSAKKNGQIKKKKINEKYKWDSIEHQMNKNQNKTWMIRNFDVKPQPNVYKKDKRNVQRNVYNLRKRTGTKATRTGQRNTMN